MRILNSSVYVRAAGMCGRGGPRGEKDVQKSRRVGKRNKGMKSGEPCVEKEENMGKGLELTKIDVCKNK